MTWDAWSVHNIMGHLSPVIFTVAKFYTIFHNYKILRRAQIPNTYTYILVVMVPYKSTSQRFTVNT